jgi:hypothetical protein
MCKNKFITIKPHSSSNSDLANLIQIRFEVLVVIDCNEVFLGNQSYQDAIYLVYSQYHIHHRMSKS